MHPAMECVLGGISTCCACVFSNPLEVVKTRMQLQGELKSKGSYTVHYRNVFHAFYTIARFDGITALQKGLVPGLYYQVVMNGLRLGSYQIMSNADLTKNQDGSLNYGKCMLAGAISGCTGAFFGSPMYMVRCLLLLHLSMDLQCLSVSQIVNDSFSQSVSQSVIQSVSQSVSQSVHLSSS